MIDAVRIASVLALLAAAGCGAWTDAEPPPSPDAAERPLRLDTAGKRILERREILPGAQAPAFSLTDQDGRPVSTDDLRGSTVVLGFIYTNCPDVCGLLVQSFLDLQAKYATAVEKGDLRLVLVTTDPERDVPDRIRGYTRAYGGRWTFLTGSLDECRAVWDAYGVHRTYNPSSEYVYHTYKIVVLDRQGDLRFDYVGVDDPQKDLFADVGSLLPSHRSELLHPAAAPGFELVDPDGRSRTLEEFRGKVVLVAFVYSRCTKICPAIAATLLEVQDAFPDSAGAAPEFLLVSLDPERDSPERAREYTESLGGRWIYLTGPRPVLEPVWSAWKVDVRSPDAAGEILHTWMIGLVDAEGRLRFRYLGQDDPKTTIIPDIRLLLGERS